MFGTKKKNFSRMHSIIERHEFMEFETIMYWTKLYFLLVKKVKVPGYISPHLENFQDVDLHFAGFVGGVAFLE